MSTSRKRRSDDSSEECVDVKRSCQLYENSENNKSDVTMVDPHSKVADSHIQDSLIMAHLEKTLQQYERTFFESLAIHGFGKDTDDKLEEEPNSQKTLTKKIKLYLKKLFHDVCLDMKFDATEGFDILVMKELVKGRLFYAVRAAVVYAKVCRNQERLKLVRLHLAFLLETFDNWADLEGNLTPGSLAASSIACIVACIYSSNSDKNPDGSNYCVFHRLCHLLRSRFAGIGQFTQLTDIHNADFWKIEDVEYLQFVTGEKLAQLAPRLWMPVEHDPIFVQDVKRAPIVLKVPVKDPNPELPCSSKSIYADFKIIGQFLPQKLTMFLVEDDGNYTFVIP